MNRTVNLLLCLGILVGGVVLEAPAEDPAKAKSDAPCAGIANASRPKTGVLSECLQYLLYEDLEANIALWSADEYSDDECAMLPSEVFMWTTADVAAPQYCTAEPGCMLIEGKRFKDELKDVKLAKKLPKDETYIEQLDDTKLVPYPGLTEDDRWDAKDGLGDFGEAKHDYVKIKGVDEGGADTWIVVRLSAGFAEFEKVAFPAGAFPQKPKIANRKIAIGFEAEAPEAQGEPTIGAMDEVAAVVWKRYSESKTAFRVRYKKRTYYVTTMTPAKTILPQLPRDTKNKAAPASGKTPPAPEKSIPTPAKPTTKKP